MDIRQKFFEAGKRRYKTVPVPMLGDVRIRSLTNAEMRTLKDSLTDDVGKINDRGRRLNELLVAACVVDDNGERVFSDDEAMGALFGDTDGAPLAVLAKACVEHTNFREVVDWQAVEDAAKN